MPTIRDVAKLAQVAPITVSRVINNSGYVSPKTRQRVEAAVRELGYVPNRVARSLRLKQSDTVALVVSDITNPFWTTVVRGVEDTAHDAGYTVILCNTDESPAKQERYLDVLLQKQVDGILLVPASTEEEIVEWIGRQSTPVVILDRDVGSIEVDIVRGDSVGGARRLVQHLLSLGHRRVAVLSGPRTVSSATNRVAGYRQAMQQAGLAIREDWVRYGVFSQESGYAMAMQVLALVPRPTALFAINNFIAIGALRALRDVGLTVPQDISLVSFDDLTSELVIEPFLTVADQPAYEMGRRAAELLLARMSETGDATPQQIVLPSELIVRASSGSPPVGRPTQRRVVPSTLRIDRTEPTSAEPDSQ